MQRKILSVILSICVVLSVVFATPIIASADIECAVEDGLYYSVSDGEATVTGHDGELNGDLIIPETLGGYPVTAIGDSAFSYCDGLTSVDIPNSVTSIGYEAFLCCAGLKSIEIPNSVTSIGCWAFGDCGGLTSVEIPNSVTSIGDCAFDYCSGLTSITIPDSVASIGFHVFYGCERLTSVEIPNSVTSIGDSAFSDCYALTSVIIPDSVTSIGNGAFSGCTGLTSIEISNSVTNIGDYAFQWCLLTSVTIPNSVTSIGQYAFQGCQSLKNINIPNSVTSIGEYAFFGCFELTSITIPNGVISISPNAFAVSGLTSIEIPNSVTSIGDEAFRETPLTTVTIPNSVTSIGDSAFSYCSLIETVYYDGTEEDKSKISIGNDNDYLLDAEWVYAEDNSKKLTYTVSNGEATITGYDGELNGDLIIPETLGGYPVTAIGDSAFSYCDGLTSVVIPDSVTSISNLAFVGCKKLTKIIVDDEDKVYSSIDGVLFNKDKTKLLYYPNGKGKSYVIPDGVTSIGELAFALCEGLTSVSIPDGVISIGHNAFDTCIALTSIEIPKSVTSIGDDAFFDCRELNSVTIPRGVTSIGERAFMLCNELKSISIPNSVTSIGEGAFEACFALTSIAIPNSVKSIGNRAFCFCERLTEIIVDVDNKNYSSIDGVLFNKDKTELLYYPCGKGESYVIPNGVISIGKYAFASQHPFASIEIPNSVIRICDSAFDFHWGLETVYYDGTEEDKSKISIGKENYCLLDAEWIYAEDNSKKLTYSVSDGKATVTGYDGELKGDLIIPETLGGYPVTEIGDEAFFGRTGLTSISIPNSVTSIGERAFWDCENLSIIIVDADNGAYCSVDGVLFNKDKTELVCYPEGKGETYVIPDGVISIGEFAFFYCNRFTSVSIPNSVTSIGKYAFDSCALTSIEIPNSVTSIGESAFGCCVELKSVIIPKSVTSIGTWGFQECFDLETVYYGGTEEDKSKISIGNDNDYLLDAEWIYAEEDIEEHTTHIYDDENDGVCNVCGEFRDFGSELLSIDVLVKPREIAYFVGKTFDPYGIMISAYFANGFYKIVQTDYTLSEIDTSTAGKKTVTVSWCGKTTEFYVDIITPNAESLANLVGIILVQPKGHLSYDLNEDGVVDLIDLVQMKKMIAS